MEIDIYKKNLEFLKKTNVNLFDAIIMYSKLVYNKELNERFVVAQNNDFLDIYDKEKNIFLYNIDPYVFAKEIKDSIKLDSSTNAFDLLYPSDYNFNTGIYKEVIDIFNYIKKYSKKNKIYTFIPKFIFIGTLLGTHIEPILEKTKSIEIIIIEPNFEFFRLSLFFVKYYEIKANITFAIGDDYKISFRKWFKENSNLNYSIKFHYFNPYKYILEDLIAIVSSSFETRMDFKRRLKAFRQSVWKIKNNYNILDIKKIDNFNKRVLILGAGESLEIDINWIRENQNKFIIVCVDAILEYLLENKIFVDIVIAVHPDENILDSHTKYNYDNILISASGVYNDLLTKFKKEKIFIFLQDKIIKRFNYKLYGGGSVGNFAFEVMYRLGAKEIYLLGFDLAFDKKTHISSHAHTQDVKGKKISLKENIILEDSKNLFEIEGNLQDKVYTNSLFYGFLEGFNNFAKTLDIKVFNLSKKGAKILNTIPKRVEELSLDNILKDNLQISLEEISENFITKEEKENINYNINMLENIIINTPKGDIRVYLKEILNNKSLPVNYKTIIASYSAITLGYIDSFLNTKGFKEKEFIKHFNKLNKLVFKYFKKITKEYIDILKFENK